MNRKPQSKVSTPEELPGVITDEIADTVVVEQPAEVTIEQPAAPSDIGIPAPLDPPPLAKVIPHELLIYEHDMQRRYLSGEVETVCEFASESADAVISQFASGTLEQREQAAVMWRKRALKSIMGKSIAVAEWLAANDNDNARAAYEGKMMLRDIDHLAFQHQMEMERETSAKNLRYKEGLRDAINSVVEDMKTDTMHRQLPNYVVFSDTGEVKFYRSEAAAKQDFFTKCNRFTVVKIDVRSQREYHGTPKE